MERERADRASDGRLSTESDIKRFRKYQRQAAIRIPYGCCFLILWVPVVWAARHYLPGLVWLAMVSLVVLVLSLVGEVITYFHCSYKLRQLENTLPQENSNPTT
jgi:hypothetical protein